MTKVKVVVASRASEAGFHDKAATGRSLRIYNFPFLEVRLFPSNTLGLPKLYNAVIQESVNDPCMLIFMHDDLHILDYYWLHQILAGLDRFQILGIVGNLRRVAGQPNWALLDDKMTLDNHENFSGVMGHGNGFPPKVLDIFGPSCQPVKLLDGLLLAAHSRTFVENDLRFDERFDFHFYDMDLCRQAEQKNVSCGTWPVSLIHESAGDFFSEAWKKAYAAYLEKWGD